MGLALIVEIITEVLKYIKEISATYVGDGEARGGLAPGDAPEAGLVLDDAVGHSHLAAQRREEQHQLEHGK